MTRSCKPIRHALEIRSRLFGRQTCILAISAVFCRRNLLSSRRSLSRLAPLKRFRRNARFRVCPLTPMGVFRSMESSTRPSRPRPRRFNSNRMGRSKSMDARTLLILHELPRLEPETRTVATKSTRSIAAYLTNRLLTVCRSKMHRRKRTMCSRVTTRVFHPWSRVLPTKTALSEVSSSMVRKVETASFNAARGNGTCHGGYCFWSC